MKRLHYFLMAALVMLALSCKKNDPPFIFNESDLIGTWVFTKCIHANGETDKNLHHAYVFNEDHTGQAIYWGTPNDIVWHGTGTKLDMRAGELTWPDINVISLDKLHLYYTQQGEQHYYTNIGNLLPGTWKASWTDRWYIVTLDAAGTSTWQLNGSTNAGTYGWSLGLSDGQAVVKFTGKAWNDDLTIYETTDDELKMKNKANGDVTFTRQP